MTVATRRRAISAIFGPPGSGKGTHAAWLAATLGVPHVSTGDLLRAEVTRGSELGREVEPIMTSGALVPDELVVRVIESRLREPDARRGILLDGFPRTLNQAQALDVMLARAGTEVGLVVALDVPRDVTVPRILHRAAEEHRSDDTAEVVGRRMEVYEHETAPVLEHYVARRGTAVRRIDGVGTIAEERVRIRAAVADPTQAPTGRAVRGRR